MSSKDDMLQMDREHEWLEATAAAWEAEQNQDDTDADRVEIGRSLGVEVPRRLPPPPPPASEGPGQPRMQATPAGAVKKIWRPFDIDTAGKALSPRRSARVTSRGATAVALGGLFSGLLPKEEATTTLGGRGGGASSRPPPRRFHGGALRRWRSGGSGIDGRNWPGGVMWRDVM